MTAVNLHSKSNLQKLQMVHCFVSLSTCRWCIALIQSEQDVQSRAGSSQEGGTTEVVCICMAHSRCARRVTGCNWSCGRFCWKIPDGWAWRAPWHHRNSTLPGLHPPPPPCPPSSVQIMTHFTPPPGAALPLALALYTPVHVVH